jgi:hypothetical protein
MFPTSGANINHRKVVFVKTKSAVIVILNKEGFWIKLF